MSRADWVYLNKRNSVPPLNNVIGFENEPEGSKLPTCLLKYCTFSASGQSSRAMAMT